MHEGKVNAKLLEVKLPRCVPYVLEIVAQKLLRALQDGIRNQRLREVKLIQGNRLAKMPRFYCFVVFYGLEKRLIRQTLREVARESVK